MNKYIINMNKYIIWTNMPSYEQICHPMNKYVILWQICHHMNKYIIIKTNMSSYKQICIHINKYVIKWSKILNEEIYQDLHNIVKPIPWNHLQVNSWGPNFRGLSRFYCFVWIYFRGLSRFHCFVWIYFRGYGFHTT